MQQRDGPETLCAQDWSNGVQMLGNGTCTGENLLIVQVFQPDMKPWKWLGEISMQSCWHGVFQDKCHHCDCPEKFVDPRLVKRSQDRSNGFQRLKNGTCTEKLLHKKKPFTQKVLHRNFDRQTRLHRGVLTQGRVYTQKPLRTEAFLHRAFTHRSLYTEKS